MALILHIGTHKTGTTLLQRFAHRHRRRLRKAGLEYPAWKKWLGVRNRYTHHDLAHAIGGNSRLIGQKQLVRFWGGIRERSQARDILISAEPMYRYRLPSYQDVGVARRAYVQRIGEWTRDIDVKILLVCRRPDTFATSMYGEHVLQTRFTGGLEDFLRQRAYLFDYGTQIDLWEASVGPVRHLCYENLKQRGIVDAFFAELGIDVSEWKRPDVVNASRDAVFVELKRQANKAGVGADDNKGCLRALERKPIGELLDNEPRTRPRSLWHSRDAERGFLACYLEKFAASPHWDEATYGGWRAEPSEKTYMREWVSDMKTVEVPGL